MIRTMIALSAQFLLLGIAQAASVPDGWPPEVTATVGDVGVRFESRSFWTLYRINYRGISVGIDQFGSHYGTVAKLKGIGFIGSGHRENKDEQIIDVRFVVDGKRITLPVASYFCNEIRMVKKSRIEAINLYSEVVVADGVITESVAYDVDCPVELDLIYHFMHPWNPSTSDYCASLPDGSEVVGTFTGANDFKLNKPIKWTAVYDRKHETGAMTRVVEAPEGRPYFVKYWDKELPYKKFYLQAYTNRTLMPGERYAFSVKVVPFAAGSSTWMDEARRIDARLGVKP